MYVGRVSSKNLNMEVIVGAGCFTRSARDALVYIGGILPKK
jgi:hypothetical protein